LARVDSDDAVRRWVQAEDVPVVEHATGTARHRAPDDDTPPAVHRQGFMWFVVTIVGVVVVTVLGAVVTARVSAIALAVLVAGCGVARVLVQPPALVVRARRTDVLVLGLLTAALVVVAIRLPTW